MLSVQCLSSLRHDGGCVTVSVVSCILALCLMIDLNGHATDKDYGAISNSRCSLGCKHCSIMMSPLSTIHYYSAFIHTATQGKCMARFRKYTVTKYYSCVFVVCTRMHIGLLSTKGGTMMCKADAVNQWYPDCLDHFSCLWKCGKK